MQRALTVLAIDDDPDDIVHLERQLGQLRDWQVTLLSAHNGFLGVEMLAAHPEIDVTFLDSSMGAGKGTGILSQLRANGEARPVIALTGADSPRQAETVREGADEYLDKRDLCPETLRLSIQGVLDRRQLRQEKALLAEQLSQSQKMEAIGTLAGGIAHDFNNMLTGIMGFIELAIMKSQGRDIERDLTHVHSNCEKMAELIQRLLTFSHQQGLAGDLVSVRKMFKELEVILSHTIPKEINIDIFFPPEDFFVQGQASQLHQVFLNLCINAAQAMPEGGDLKIRVRLANGRDAQRHGPREEAESTYVLIEVADTGTGIPKNIQSRIFDPFFTTKNVGARKGTGLGLAVTCQIVKDHGGFIEVESEPGRGSAFKVFFPVPMCALEKEEVVVRFEIPEGTETLLLVDDERLVREVASEMLQQLGYNIVEAEDGLKAIELYHQHADSIRLVILDLSMPRMGGKECMKRLHEIEPDLPILCSSGHHMESEKKGLQAEGARDVIQKPFRLEALAKAIRQILDNPGVTA